MAYERVKDGIGCQACGRVLTQKEWTFWGECPCGRQTEDADSPRKLRPPSVDPSVRAEIQFHGSRFYAGEW